MGRSTWYDSVRRGDLVALHPNVARLPGSPERREQSILGAILALRQGANAPTVVMASHRSAAFLLGVERPPTDPIDVIVDRACQRSLPGVEIHRPTDRIDLVPTTRSGVTTSNELRTLVDLGALDPSGVTAALDLFTVTRRLTMAGLSELLARHSRKGRAGVTALRRAVEAWPLADDIPDSELEIAMARLITDHGLPTASFHRRIAEYEVDFHFDARRSSSSATAGRTTSPTITLGSVTESAMPGSTQRGTSSSGCHAARCCSSPIAPPTKSARSSTDGRRHPPLDTSNFSAAPVRKPAPQPPRTSRRHTPTTTAADNQRPCCPAISAAPVRKPAPQPPRRITTTAADNQLPCCPTHSAAPVRKPAPQTPRTSAPPSLGPKFSAAHIRAPAPETPRTGRAAGVVGRALGVESGPVPSGA